MGLFLTNDLLKVIKSCTYFIQWRVSTFKTEDLYKIHKERVYGERLPIWCRGIMGGCV